MNILKGLKNGVQGFVDGAKEFVNEVGKTATNVIKAANFCILTEDQADKILESHRIVNKIVEVASVIFLAMGVSLMVLGLLTAPIGGIGLVIPGAALSYLFYNTYKICLHLRAHFESPFDGFLNPINIAAYLALVLSKENNMDFVSTIKNYPVIQKESLVNTISKDCFFGRPVVWLAVELINGILTLQIAHLKKNSLINN
jgi:hypothetical protein